MVHRGYKTLLALAAVGVLLLEVGQGQAEMILGTGTASLLGGDLTDPENDGAPDADTNYNATFFGNDEAAFGGGEFAFNVFDNQVGGGNMKWCCGVAGGFPEEGLWVEALLHSGPHFLTHFTVSSANDTPGRDPTEWAIQGSNDGVNFDTIFEHVGDSFWTERNQVIKFTAGEDFPEQVTAYSSFRFVAFNSVNNPTGAYFQLAELEYFGEPLDFAPGDFDLDGSVDLDDFNTLVSNFNSTGSFADGDIDFNRKINLTDFAKFRVAFNSQAGPVPEPSTGLLVLLGVAGFALFRGKRIIGSVRWSTLVLLAVVGLAPAAANAELILGVGTGALLGGDLTDPEDDGAADADVNYNAIFSGNDEPGFGGGEFAFNVFDNQVGGGNMKWCCGVAGGFPADVGLWVQAELRAPPHFLTHFTIASANDTPGRDPTEWAILGSNDGVNFTPIFEHSGDSFWTERNQVIQFSAGEDFPEQETAYRIFRFAAFNSVNNPNGAYFQLAEIEYFGNPIEFLAGDFNNDDTLDLDDYDILRNNFQTGDTYEEGDFTFDGHVDLHDFVGFRVAFNGQAGAVPEPTSLVLLSLGLPLFLFRGRNTIKRIVARSLPLVLIAGLMLATSTASAQINVVGWNVAGPEDWMNGNNWGIGSVPDGALLDAAQINNAGTAFLEDAAPGVSQLLVDNGILEIRNGGSLGVIMDDLEPATGIGRTSAAGTIRMQGNGSLQVAGKFTNAGMIDLQSADATFQVDGDFQQLPGGRLQIAANGANGTISVAGEAKLGGTLIIDPATDPQFGDSWIVLTADTISNSFSSVQFATGTAPLDRGLALAAVSADGLTSAFVENRPILVIDRSTGKTDITNVIGNELSITGYSITSANGLLNTVGWQSLAGAGVPGWADANPHANAISELNLMQSSEIAVGGVLSIGNAYNAVATHPSDEDVVFQFVTADNRVLNGFVEYTGPVNDLVLNIDPATGEAAISNLSILTEDFDLTGFSILSASGSLLTEGWNGLDGFTTANPQSTAIAQVNLTGSMVFNNGSLAPLGKIVDPGFTQDLVFEFSLNGAEVTRFGTVSYGAFSAGLASDFNGDGSVDLADFNILKGNFGMPGGKSMGDANGDGNIDLQDFNVLKGQFGQSGSAAVPEPASLVLLAMGAFAVCGFGWKNRKSK